MLRNEKLVALLKRAVDALVKGPDASSYENGTCYVIGEARNARGDVRRAQVSTPNGYRLTVDGMLMTVKHLLANPQSSGFHTPTTLMGAHCVESLPGVSLIHMG